MPKQYCNIVFVQNIEEEPEIQAFFAGDKTAAELVDYLAQWDNGGESEHCLSLTTDAPWGTADDVETIGDYILTTNSYLRYAGLVRLV